MKSDRSSDPMTSSTFEETYYKPTKSASTKYLRFSLQLRVLVLVALNLTTCYFAKQYGRSQWTLTTDGKIQQFTQLPRENLFYRSTRKPVLILTLPLSSASVISLEIATYLLLFIILCLNLEARTGLIMKLLRLKSAGSVEKNAGIFILPVLILTMCTLVEEFIDSASNFDKIARVLETFDSCLLMFMNVFLCCIKLYLWLGAVEIYEKTTKGYLPFFSS